MIAAIDFLQNQDPIPVRITRPLPRQREVNLNSWRQNSFESIGSAFWGTIPPVAAYGQQVVRSARHPKVFFHPYQLLLHDRRPLAGLSEFVAAGSGES